jgi:uncharacterized membrane-anchored protein
MFKASDTTAQLTNIDCKSHPLRTALYEELHIRPFHNVTTPLRISHLAFRAEKPVQAEAFELLCDVCRRYNTDIPDSRAGSFVHDFGEFTLHWESHVEFYSITVMCPLNKDGEIFEPPAVVELPSEWLSKQPGEVVAAFHLAVVAETCSLDNDMLDGVFDQHPVSISETADGNATLYTAFRLHSDGFGRFVVRNQGKSDEQMGRLTRRLIEMETYRLFAMMALPLAIQIAPQLWKWTASSPKSCLICQRLKSSMKSVNSWKNCRSMKPVWKRGGLKPIDVFLVPRHIMK